MLEKEGSKVRDNKREEKKIDVRGLPSYFSLSPNSPTEKTFVIAIIFVLEKPSCCLSSKI